MLVTCKANVDYQSVVSKRGVFKYSLKYVIKSKKRLESYTKILDRLAHVNTTDDNALLARQKFMMGFVFYHDIRAHEA